MFDFAWSEIALIGVVALIAIGPKDMPVAIKTVTNMIKKARRMAAEFQTHVDEMMREADLDDVRKQVNEIRNFNFKGEVERAVDPDGSLRTTFARNPLAPDLPKAAVGALSEAQPLEQQQTATLELAEADAPAETAVVAQPAANDLTAESEQSVAQDDIPAFIPPEFAKPLEPPPAFVPPAATKQAVPVSRF